MRMNYSLKRDLKGKLKREEREREGILIERKRDR